ncbi:MAG TPA: response regulator [Crinalium sp.]
MRTQADELRLANGCLGMVVHLPNIFRPQSIRPLERQRQLLLAFPILCLVTTLVSIGWHQIKTNEAERWVRHSQEVHLETERLLTALLNAETGVRGFDLTRRSGFLEPYYTAIASVPVSLDRLTQLVSDNPLQSRRMLEIRRLAVDRMALLEQNFQSVNSGRANSSSSNLFSTLQLGKQRMDQVRTKIDEFLREEEWLQDQRTMALRQQRHILWVILAVAGIVGIGGSLVVMYLIGRLEQQLIEREKHLLTLSECNQALVRAADERTLLHDICRIIVEFGGYRAAWIGFVEPGSPKRIRPVAHAGNLADHSEAFLCDAWENREEQNPIEAVIQTGQTRIVQNLLTAFSDSRWREIALSNGYQSLIGLPLLINAEPIGVLAICSAQANSFNAEDVKLLTELSDDLAYGITALRTQAERQQAQDEIIRLNQNLERRANESETRYRQIVELAEEGVWVVDADCKTTYVNHAMARMLSYTEAEMLGCPVTDFINNVNEARLFSAQFQSQGRVIKHEVQLKSKEGCLLWAYMSTSPVFDSQGTMLWSCALVYDITDRKRTEEQLRLSSDRISLANAELARATRLKDEFLAGMSHELRTPLNAILGLSEALLEEVYGSLTAKQRQSLGTIEGSGKHLLELINDILDLSKVESGKLELQLTSASVPLLCEASMSFVKQEAQRKNINLQCQIEDGLTEIEIDERRIRQVLINLLSNAVKFTPVGGSVQLQVDVDAFAEMVQFSVIDTGIGIAPENIDKLFRPFVQLDSSLSRRYSGTGLGLALAKRITELHEGSISLDSRVGKGSRFTISLPWKPSHRESTPVLQSESVQVALPSIRKALVVEDSEAAASQISRYLTELGADVSVGMQGEGVLETVLRYQPDVIILDVLLPYQSGWEILSQLKSNSMTQAIPVIVISVMDERSRALAMGANEFLLKPITRPQFRLTLKQVFANLPPVSAPVDESSPPPQPARSPVVLLAEDNEANIMTLMDYLQIQGMQVVLARNGIEAVQMAQQEHPDLILMDIQMPEMDGLEAMRKIRSDQTLNTIPMIALTALAMSGDRERCIAAGASEYISKPVSLKELTRLVSKYISTIGDWETS